MPSNTFPSDLASKVTRHTVKEEQIEYGFIDKLQGLKYVYREDIRDRAALEQNFREKFENLNRVNLSKGEFKRLLDEIVTPDVFTAARRLRERSAFTRDDGTPLNYTLVNIKDWCKNTFEVVNQLRINTDYSHHRYDVLILINGVPCVQVELKTLGINPKRAMEQIVDYKNDPGTDHKILSALAAQPLGRSPLLSELGYSQPTGNYKAAMTKLLQTRLIEPTIPDKPNSRLQQYRLTAQGRALLK